MLSYRNLTKYRNVWMALAALWILYYHVSLPTFGCALLHTAKNYGYGGVDIFVFASGLGCYHSLTKRYDPPAFFKKRVLRILPSYYAVLIPWVIFQALRVGVSAQAVAANFLCVDFLARSTFQTMWYMNAVWVYYLAALFLVPACRDASRIKKAFLLLFCFAFAVPFLMETRLVLFARLPIFLLGILFAEYGSTHEGISPRAAVAAVIASMVGWVLLSKANALVGNADLMWGTGLFWWPFILITPGLCLVFSLICTLVERFAPQVNRALAKLGGCTLELYAIHALLLQFANAAIADGYIQGSNLFWAALALVSIVLAVLLAKATACLSVYLQRRNACTTH